jgi:hypothetical protein
LIRFTGIVTSETRVRGRGRMRGGADFIGGEGREGRTSIQTTQTDGNDIIESTGGNKT